MKRMIDKIKSIKWLSEGNIHWFNRLWFIVFVSIFYPLIGLLFLWISPVFRRWIKIIASVGLIAYFIYGFITLNYKDRMNYYETPGQTIARSLFHRELETYLPKYHLNDINYKKADKKRSILSTEEIADIYNKCTIKIDVYDKNRRLIKSGSGVIISPKGYILTNSHIISGAYSADITLSDNRVFKEVFLVKNNFEPIDLAVLKINRSGLSCGVVGNSDTCKVGEEIVTVGNPSIYDFTVSKGIISSLRDMGEFSALQISAPASFGSSGGPVINKYGEIIGIITLGANPWNAQNITLAIPINCIK